MNCELVVFVIFCQFCFTVKFDMFTDRILDFDCYRCIFRTVLFVSDVSEIPISFPFLELPFSILFPIKNMKTVMVLVFTDRFRPFSSLISAVVRSQASHSQTIARWFWWCAWEPRMVHQGKRGGGGTLLRPFHAWSDRLSRQIGSCHERFRNLTHNKKTSNFQRRGGLVNAQVFSFTQLSASAPPDKSVPRKWEGPSMTQPGAPFCFGRRT
jgi:hypothetical protein